MISITQVNRLHFTDVHFFLSVSSPRELAHLIPFRKEEVGGFSLNANSVEGLFLVKKEGKAVGFGTVIAAPSVPLTAGVGLLQHCFIIPTERRKGYGNQLYRHLCQFAQNSFGLLQLNEKCPLYERTGGMIELF